MGIAGGRLPMTWYPQEYVEQVPMTDMTMRANSTRNYPGRTYRFYTGKTIYPFGHGLSFTTFSKLIYSAPTTINIHPISTITRIFYKHISTDHKDFYNMVDVSDVDCNGLKNITIGVGVRNDGSMNGTYVVLLFWKPPTSAASNGAPTSQLIGFDRVEVGHNQQENVSLVIDVCRDFSLADEKAGVRKIMAGQHTLLVGATSERQVRHHIYVRVPKNSTTEFQK